eukprot:jgi/Ulvmu1/12304/UM088_0024.1
MVECGGGALVCAGIDFTESFYDCTFRNCRLYVAHGAVVTLRGCTHTASLPGLVTSSDGTRATATECTFHNCSPALCAEHGAVLAVHDARFANVDVTVAVSGAGTHAELSRCEVEWRKQKGRASDPHGGCVVRVVGEGGALAVLERCVLPEAAAFAVEIANGKAALLLCAVISVWTGLCARGERSAAVMQHCVVETEEHGAVAHAGAAIWVENCHMSSTDSACVAMDRSRFALVASVVSGKGRAGQPAVMATPGGQGLSMGYGSNVEIVGCVFLGQPASYTWLRSQTEWPEQPTVSVFQPGRVLIFGCMYKQFRVIFIGGGHECVIRECDFTGTVPHAPELICLYNRSRALIELSRFSNASTAIKMDSSVCRVLGLSTIAGSRLSTTAVLEDCDCKDMLGGILLTGAEVMFTARRLSMSLLAEATGLNVRTGCKGGPIAALLEDCTLAGGRTLALLGHTGAHATLLRCTLRGGETGVDVMGGASVTMRDSRVEECDVGVRVGPTRS